MKKNADENRKEIERSYKGNYVSETNLKRREVVNVPWRLVKDANDDTTASLRVVDVVVDASSGSSEMDVGVVVVGIRGGVCGGGSGGGEIPADSHERREGREEGR